MVSHIARHALGDHMRSVRCCAQCGRMTNGNNAHHAHLMSLHAYFLLLLLKCRIAVNNCPRDVPDGCYHRSEQRPFACSTVRHHMCPIALQNYRCLCTSCDVCSAKGLLLLTLMVGDNSIVNWCYAYDMPCTCATGCSFQLHGAQRSSICKNTVQNSSIIFIQVGL